MFYDIFMSLCEKNGVRPGRVADELNIRRSNVTSWKQSGYTPRGAALDKIAEYFHVTTDYLLGKTNDPHIHKADPESISWKSDTSAAVSRHLTVDNAAEAQRQKWISEHGIPAIPATHFAPILGQVRAGVGGLAVQEVTGEEPLPFKYADDGESYFWLIVEGDSMEPRISEGDFVLVRAQDSVDSGSIAVVTVDDEEGVVKKVCYGDGWIELRSFNLYYPPRRFEGEEVLRIRVMGRVVESKRTW